MDDHQARILAKAIENGLTAISKAISNFPRPQSLPAIADSPPDGRTIIDPPPSPPISAAVSGRTPPKDVFPNE